MEPVSQSTVAANGISLPLRITVIVYWGLMLAGLAVTLVLLRNMDGTMAAERAQKGDLLAYYIAELIARDGVSDLGRLSDEIRRIRENLGIDAVDIDIGTHTVHSGKPAPDASHEKRQLPLFSSHNGEPAYIVIYRPALKAELATRRKQLILMLSGGFFIFGIFLTAVLRRVLSQPFTQMISVSQQIAAGQTQRRFDTERRDEFGYLARFINDVLESLVAEKEKLQVTLHSIGDGVVTTDRFGIVQYINPVAERILGLEQAEARGRPITEAMPLIDEETRKPLPSPVEICIRDGETVQLAERAALMRPDGRETPIADSAAPIKDGNGVVIGSVMVFRDVAQERRTAYQLSYQATHDDLTGLLNRREFEHQLQQIVHSAQHDRIQHALCYLDLDQFKVINDTCGHTAGDELLRQLSDILRVQVRGSDIIARLGGDEFAIVLRGCQLERAQQVAETIRKTISDFRFNWNDRNFDIGASIGVVAIGAETQNIAEVLSAADIACYEAKNTGRDRVHVYRASDRELEQRWGEMRWVSRIKTAIAENQFRLYCQPIVPLSTAARQTAHYEVLLRLVDENQQIVLPMAFIPAAERYNLMPAIDRWVVRNTLQFVSAHRRLDTYFSINLSGQSLCDDSFLPFVLQTLREYVIDGSSLCFEITETAAIVNLRQASKFIGALKAVGCRFALDDFGRGFCSFAYLKNLDVDFLKIDGSFVKDMTQDPIDRATVEAINQVGHVMGISTIAEFVENQDILRELNLLGVDYAQGFEVGKPSPLADLVGVQNSTLLGNAIVNSSR